MDKSPGKGAIPVINMSIARCPRTLEKGAGLPSSQLCGHLRISDRSKHSAEACNKDLRLLAWCQPDLAEVYPERRHAQESRLC